ncbi:MAG TPA: hypothetical protein VF210_04475 [Pseudomonadales bacterium]
MGSMKAWGWLSLAAWLGMPAALAQVTLQTDVAKVVSTLDAGGRVERELVPVEEVMPGEELRYTITFRNESNTPVEGERIVITNPLPEGTVYVPGSAGGEGTMIEYSVDGQSWSPVEPSAGVPAPGVPASAMPAAGDPAGDSAPRPLPNADAASPVRSLRWTYRQELPPGASGSVFFHVRMQ